MRESPAAFSGHPTSVAGPRRLLHLSPLADVGGCEVNCLRLIEGLGDFQHQVLVFGEPGPMSARWEAAGASVEHLSTWVSGSQKFQRALNAWADAQTKPAGVFSWSTSRLPVVLDVLGGWGVPWAVHLGNPVVRNFSGRMRRILHEVAYGSRPNIKLIACSGHVAASHRAVSYFRGFPIETIFNPVSPAFDRPQVYRDLPPGSGPRVGMVARLDSIKDHLTVVQALAALSAVRDDVVVEFAGQGELKEFLQYHAARLGIAGRVRFLGAVSDVPGLIANWDVYLHSTTAAEGMGTAVAEAMMAGLPCVVTDIGVMHEVCGEKGAVYAPAADPAAWARTLQAMIGDHARRRALGLVAQTRARRLFALPEVAARYLQVVCPNARRDAR